MDSISSDVRRFEDEFALLLERRGKIPVHQDSMDRYWFVHVPADRPPWTDTGIEVVVGERAEMFRTPKGSLTFTAGHSGRLYLSNVFPGQWVDAYGRMPNAAVLEESD